MSKDEQLQWEARWAISAAIASFGAALLLVVSATLFLPKDRKGVGRAPRSAAVDRQAVRARTSPRRSSRRLRPCSRGVFLYLFRATELRGGGVPHWFVYLVYGAPVLFAIGAVAYALQAVDIGRQVRRRQADPGQAGSDRAKDLTT